MIEVFRTNVKDKKQAKLLLRLLKENFQEYQVNFDLKDQDKILRVKNEGGVVKPKPILDLLKDVGVQADVLLDSSPNASIQRSSPFKYQPFRFSNLMEN